MRGTDLTPQQIEERLKLLDEAIDVLRDIQTDDPRRPAAMRVYAKWCDFGQEAMDAHIAKLRTALGREPTTEEIYKDAP